MGYRSSVHSYAPNVMSTDIVRPVRVKRKRATTRRNLRDDFDDETTEEEMEMEYERTEKRSRDDRPRSRSGRGGQKRSHRMSQRSRDVTNVRYTNLPRGHSHSSVDSDAYFGSLSRYVYRSM